MSRLNELRARLTKLHRLRRGARLGTAWLAVAVAILWSLAGLFLVDWLFEMTRAQRVIALVVACAAVYWAYRRFAAPLLHEGESLLDVALLVERQQRIDSDLVAALQFESIDARQWGSAQLESAVIEYVADFSSGLDVFEGFNREQMTRRGAIAAVSAGALLLAALLFPAHALTFFQRLFMSSAHYPTRTTIAKVWINGQEVSLTPGSEEVVRCAYGQPLTIEVEAGGEIPASGMASLWTLGGLNTELALERALHADAPPAQDPQRAETPSSAAGARAPTTIKSAASRPGLALAATASPAPSGQDEAPSSSGAAAKTLAEPESPVTSPGVKFAGVLPRLIDSLQYQLYLGDAWTEPALVKVIPLPKIEFTLTPTPPEYARRAEETLVASSARQFSVVEGSRVDLEVTSDKRLAEARVTIEEQTYALEPVAGAASDGLDHWRLVTENTPLAAVLGPLAYTIEAKDQDGLRPPQPIQGFIRLRADRPPRIFGTIGARNVRSTAKQPIAYQATDDFGVNSIRLRVQVGKPNGGDAMDDGEERVYEIRPHGKPAPRIDGTYTLNLGELRLEKGDQVTVVLEAEDYRGQNEGRVAQSEPLVMFVTDESGVLADLTELDEQAARQFEAIIKLGIGDKP